MQEKKYCAFISYRHLTPDQEIAQKLHTAIETYGIPASVRQRAGRRRMGRVFRDQEELPLSSDLGADIEAALDDSEWLICVCSPRYLESNWCLRELEYFLERHGRDRVLTILTEGEPRDSFPEMLRFAVGPDGRRQEIEPLAADVRGGSLAESLKKLRGEKLRLLAPMLSVSYDDLKQRARQRRTRIAAAVAAAVLVLGAGTGVYLARDAAKKAELRLQAELQKQAADAERRTAVGNSIGELLKSADGARTAEETFTAVDELLEALALSDENDRLRREEIIDQLRRTIYTEPYEVLSRYGNQNVRLLNIQASPDGRRLIGIVNSNSVAMIDLDTRQTVYEVSVNNAMLNNLRFSPDGKRFLATCDEGRQVCVWRTEDGTLEYTYTSRRDQKYNIANALFWRNSNTLLIQDMAQFFFVTLDGTETLLYTLGEQQSGYDPNDNLITQSFGKSISEILTIHTDDYTGMNIAVAPDWSKILISGRDGSTGVIILSPEGKRICLLDGLPGTLGEEFVFSSDGSLVTYLSDGFGLFGTFDANTGKLKYIYALDGSSHGSPHYIPGTGRLAFLTNDNLLVMDGESAELCYSMALDSTMYVPTLQCAPDGKTLLVLAQDLYVVDAESGALILRMPADAAAPYNNAVFARGSLFLTKNDGSASICALGDTASVWTAERYDGKLARPYDPAAADAAASLHGEHKLTEGFLNSTALVAGELEPRVFAARDEKQYAIAYADGVIELFDADGDGSVKAMISQLSREITALGIVNDRLVAADGGGRMLLYRTDTGEVQKILNTDWRYTDFAFSADGDRLMARRLSWKEIDVYDLEAGELLFTLSSTAYLSDYGFSYDGALAVAYTGGGVVLGELYADEETLIEKARALQTLYK